MYRKNLIALTLMLCPIASMASIKFSALISGAIGTGAGTNYPGDALSAGSEVWIVWSEDNQYGTEAYTNRTVTGDYVIYTGTLTSAGLWSGDLDGTTTYTDSHVGGNNINAGYLYMIAFNGDITAGTWYAYSGFITNTATFPDYDYVPGSTLQPSLDFTCTSVWEFADNGQIISEDGGDSDGDGIPDDWELTYWTNLTIASSNTDFDSDGFLDGHEQRAGTIPTNSLSRLYISESRQDTTNTYLVTWPSVTNRAYSVLRGTNIMSIVTPRGTNIPAAPPFNTFTDSVPATVTRFYYRIMLQE